MEKVITIQNLKKVYGETIALNGVSLTLEKGKVYGLIGRNGAGKTTLMKLIANLIFATEGEIVKNPTYVSSNEDVCFARDFNFYFSNYKVRDILFLASNIYKKWDHELQEELLQEFELDQKKTYMKISKGMQTMVSLIIALCSNARVLLLDEPYAGLDPINREYFYKILRERYFDGEKTVVISSHLITEIEGYFENAIIINKGNILVNDTTERIYEKAFTVVGNEAVYESLKNRKNIVGLEKFTGQHTIYVQDSMNPADIRKIEDLGGEVKGMDLQKLMICLCANREVK